MPLDRRRSSPDRRRFGYDGCGTDLFAFLVVAGLGLWGAHWWNHLAHRPLGLGVIPVPRIIQRIPGWHPRSTTVTVPPRPQSTPPPPVPTPAPTPIAATPAPATPAPTVPSPTPTPPPAIEATPTPTPALKVPVTKLTPVISPSADPLSAPATTVALHGSKVYLGLSDGGIAIGDKGTKGGTAVRLPQAVGAVRALTVGADGSVYWLAGTDNRLFAYQPKDKSLRSFDVSPSGPPPAVILSGVDIIPGEKGEIVVLSGEGSTILLDPVEATLLEPGAILPEEAATAAAQPATSLFFASDPTGKEGTSLLVVGGENVAPGNPAVVSLWKSAKKVGRDSWVRVPVDSTFAPIFNSLLLREKPGRSAVALTPTSAALLSKPRGGQTLAAGQIWTARWKGDSEPELHPYGTLPDGVFGLWSLPERVSIGKSGVWWVLGGSIFHEAAPGASAEVYLPWNGAGTKVVSALLADDDGVWVATEKGLHHINPAKSSEQNGFSGFVRAHLGADCSHPPANPVAQKIDKLTQEWKGTKYLWGGDGKSGVDCSGYVSAVYRGVGVSLPRSTKELATCTPGQRIRDELHYGDVLVFPGHCAVYVGNGLTSEAMTDSGVGQAAIWTRKDVIVRRFTKM